ncbi:MAG: T9SS type A sorting domain-containing protein, partial [Chitinophagales bacterium]
SDVVIEGDYNAIWWDYGEGNIMHTKFPDPYTYTSGGTHTVTCYVQYGNNDDCIISFSQTINLEIAGVTRENNLFIFPNPSNSYINIFTDENALNGDIYITDVTGSLIRKINLKGNNFPFTKIPVKDLVPGFYFISHIKDDSLLTGSFIVVPEK